MTGDDLLRIAERQETYLRTYDSCMGARATRHLLRVHSRGQLGPIERKSLEPIADAEGLDPTRLQFFFSRYGWDEDAVARRLRKHVIDDFAGPDGIFVVDETSDAKKGEHTAGVARQYCGESGKIDNCIVSVHLAYVRGSRHALIDAEEFLPDSWDADPSDPERMARRRKAGIPDDLRHVTKPDIALQQIRRALEEGVIAGYVTGDEVYGTPPTWREAVARLGLRYVVEVRRTVEGWMDKVECAEPKAPGSAGRPRTKPKPTLAARPVDELARAADGLRFQKWTRFVVQESTKGPEIWEFKVGRFLEACVNRPRGTEQWLLVGRNVRTGERKYFLSNAPDGTPLEWLVRVAFARWHVERCFQDCKTELGLNHAELRKWRGIKRHLILTMVNYYFLTKLQAEEKKLSA